MNTIVKNKAEKWAESHRRWSPYVKDEDFYDKLKSELSIFHFVKDRLDFINYYQSVMQGKYNDHVEICENESCKAYKKIDVINFYSNQENETLKQQIEKEKEKAQFKTYIENVTIGGKNQVVNLGEIPDGRGLSTK